MVRITPTDVACSELGLTAIEIDVAPIVAMTLEKMLMGHLGLTVHRAVVDVGLRHGDYHAGFHYAVKEVPTQLKLKPLHAYGDRAVL